MIGRVRESFAGNGGRLGWVPLVYVMLVPSLMFLTNIGERVYQDVFFLGLFLWAVLRRQAEWSPGNAVIWGVWIAYVLWATLTDYFGSGQLTDDWFRGAALLMLLPWLLAWSSREAVREAISIGLRLALAVAAVTALVQVYFLDVPRAHGSENANIFALLMTIYGVFVINEALRCGSRWTPLWALLAFVPLVLSGSRTALGAFVLVLALLLVIHRRRLPLKRALIGFVGVGIVVGVVGLPQLVERADALRENLAATQDGSVDLWRDFVEMDFVVPDGEGFALKGQLRSSVGARLVYWRAGWEVFKANPWVGVGSEGDMIAVGEVIGVGDRLAQRHSHVHNTFLQHLLSGGIPKLLLLAAVLVMPILMLWRQGNREGAGLLTAVTLVASLAGLTAIVFELHQFVFIYTLVLAYALTGSRRRETTVDGTVTDPTR